MTKAIVVILGHPDPGNVCSTLAESYAEAGTPAGHAVKLFRLGVIDFDPVLHPGYRQRQELEPGLADIRSAITDCNPLVFVYPIWWGVLPVLLKGFIDRVFLPGSAFRYRENSQFRDKLMVERSAHAIVTRDMPPW